MAPLGQSWCRYDCNSCEEFTLRQNIELRKALVVELEPPPGFCDLLLEIADLRARTPKKARKYVNRGIWYGVTQSQNLFNSQSGACTKQRKGCSLFDSEWIILAWHFAYLKYSLKKFKPVFTDLWSKTYGRPRSFVHLMQVHLCRMYVISGLTKDHPILVTLHDH